MDVGGKDQKLEIYKVKAAPGPGKCACRILLFKSGITDEPLIYKAFARIPVKYIGGMRGLWINFKNFAANL